MNSLYSLGVRQTTSLNSDLDVMAASSESSSASLQGQIAASLAALSRTIEDYDSMAKKEMVSAKQEKALIRVAKFREDFKRIRERFAELKKMQKLQAESTARSTLLDEPPTPSSATRHRGAAATSGPSSPTHESPFLFRPNNPRPHQQPHYQAGSRTEHDLREAQFADQAESQIDLLIAQGQAVWGDIRDQRGWLKGTRKRLLDAANGIKGGREVVGWVERRTKQDTVIFFVGVTVTVCSFFVIWYYLG